MRAHLDHAARLASHLHHLSPFVDRLRERLLAVDVLAGPAGHDRLQRVPVVGRGDQHRVDIRLIEDLAEVTVRGRLAAEQLRVGLLHRGLRDIAHGGDLTVGVLQEELHHLAAPIPGADHSQANALVGAQHAGCLECRHAQRGGHAGLGEGPS